MNRNKNSSNIGRLFSPSLCSSSIEWKVEVGSLYGIFASKGKMLQSPLFQRKNELMKFSVFVSGKRDYRKLRLFLLGTNNTASSLRLHEVGKLGIKAKDGSVYRFVDISDTHSCIVTVPELKQNMNEIDFNGEITFFVDFNDGEIEYQSSFQSPFKEYSAHSKQLGVVDVDNEICGEDSFFKRLKNLFINEQYCDVSIQVGDHQFKAHKLILSARSTVFEAMFQHNMTERKSGEVNVTDCEPHIFQDFLLYMYSGKIETISADNFFALYTVADKYNVVDLKADCVDYLKENLSKKTFCDAIKIAVQHDETELLQLSKQFFLENARDIFLGESWLLLMKNNTAIANELLLFMVPEK